MLQPSDRHRQMASLNTYRGATLCQGDDGWQVSSPRDHRDGGEASVTLSWEVGFLDEVTSELSLQGGVGVGQMARKQC